MILCLILHSSLANMSGQGEVDRDEPIVWGTEDEDDNIQVGTVLPNLEGGDQKVQDKENVNPNKFYRQPTLQVQVTYNNNNLGVRYYY